MKLIIIGASAGGLWPISQILTGLPVDIAAAIVIIRHLSPDSPDQLTSVLAPCTRLTVVPVQDGLTLQAGHVYVAQPSTQVRFAVSRDQGDDGKLVAFVATDGAEGQRSSPTIDVALTDAAPLLGRNLIAVILSGRLDDGTQGASALATWGGTTIVQHPSEADYSAMPRSVIDRNTPEYIVVAAQIPALLIKLSGVAP